MLLLSYIYIYTYAKLLLWFIYIYIYIYLYIYLGWASLPKRWEVVFMFAGYMHRIFTSSKLGMLKFLIKESMAIFPFSSDLPSTKTEFVVTLRFDRSAGPMLEVKCRFVRSFHR